MHDTTSTKTMSDSTNSVTDNTNYVVSTNRSNVMSHFNDLRVTKKKSRGSKRQSPVTILNADASNFRALVQELTGRPSAPARVRANKGPLNINFRQAKEQDVVFPVFGYHHQSSVHVDHHQKKNEDDHAMMLSSGVQSNQTSLLSISDDHPRMNLDEFDDVDLDVEQCLEELASIGEGGYYQC